MSVSSVHIYRAAFPDTPGPGGSHRGRPKSQVSPHTKDLTTYACQQTYSHYSLTDAKGVGSHAIHFNRTLLSTSLGMVPNFRCSVLKRSAFRQARFQSTNPHFYQNRQLELYAAREAQRLSLRQLVNYMVHSKLCSLRAVPL